ncbi:hypothetical protein [Halobacterium litoreum]|uniref:Glycosyl transferase family 8 n=1 Tax=Halobacterium litoreum TaxID=2039234 RepID=A0ABD5NAN9_9EURY|nr:hypothetical protein [Halobacterium litoreum]UHH14736.1 hypothetical protein LT972_06965 [Halobacterium litoreum]
MTNEETVFAITADQGAFGNQALALARSIQTHHPDAGIVVFVPETGARHMSSGLLEGLGEIATVEIGPYPDPEYPISAQLRAFELAAERSGVERAVMLDTDIILLDSLTFSADDAALSARPCTLRGSFWTNNVSIPVWETLYERYGFDEPTRRVSSVLGGELPYPFYNSAVVVAHDLSIPKRLLDVTMDIRSENSNNIVESAGNETPLFYSDQVALSLLAQEYPFTQLLLKNNYPVTAFLRIPSSVAGLHYGDRKLLSTALPQTEWDEYAELLELESDTKNWMRRALSVGWFRVANRIPYRFQTFLRRVANSRHAP